jgi:hypothetical protein
MTIGLALTMAQPVLQRGRWAVVDVALIAVTFGILLGGLAQTIVVIFAAGLFGAAFLGRGRPTSSDAPMG